MKRVFLFVLDSFGIGALPDAAAFGDRNPNTLKSISASRYFCAENLKSLGLGLVAGAEYLGGENPLGAYGKMREASAGKDTTIGHWEIAGIISKKPMPTYPNGFPHEIIEEFKRKTGRGVLCNRTYSGTEVIKDCGDAHIKTGDLIVYTSADSVFQIAAHEDVLPIEKLYECCRTAREILCGEHAVGRVIARPFAGTSPDFYRTKNRHDFSLAPPKDTLLDYIKNAGQTVLAIGKINDIFAGKGISEYVYTASNADGMEKAKAAQGKDFSGLCFINLVDFDSLYGHRQDADGYANAIAEFDCFLPEFIKDMRDGDLLIITADHGCDPSDDHTDHTREYVPLLVYGKSVKPRSLGTRNTFADVAASVAKYLGVAYDSEGESFL